MLPRLCVWSCSGILLLFVESALRFGGDGAAIWSGLYYPCVLHLVRCMEFVVFVMHMSLTLRCEGAYDSRTGSVCLGWNLDGILGFLHH